MVFALVFSLPFVFLLSLVIAWVARLRGPQGVSALTWLVMIGSAGMGLISSVMTVRLMAVDGGRAQERMLGRQYVGALDLVGYRDSEIPDPGQTWRYRLRPVSLASLSKRCLPRRLPGETCYLSREGDENGGRYVSIEEGELVVAEYSL